LSHLFSHSSTQALKAPDGEVGHRPMHSCKVPPGQPVGVGGGGVGPEEAGSEHVLGDGFGQFSPLSFQHGGDFLSSSGQSDNSSYWT